jgi:hypothetical protein
LTTEPEYLDTGLKNKELKKIMGYCVRLLTSSVERVPLQKIRDQAVSLQLVSGDETAWDKIEISQPVGSLIAVLERYSISAEGTAAIEMQIVKETLQGSYPLNAREWIRNYMAGIRVIYTFRLEGEQITSQGWPILGRVQNLLKDTLGGIIQADQEGFYNEEGNYILWQMYDGAAGTIPAAVLNDEREWTAYQLRLNDSAAVELFKQGSLPPKGFLNRFLGR